MWTYKEIPFKVQIQNLFNLEQSHSIALIRKKLIIINKVLHDLSYRYTTFFNENNINYSRNNND